MHIKMKMPGTAFLTGTREFNNAEIPNVTAFTNNNSSIATMCHIVLVPDLVVKLYATGAILLE